MAGPLALAICPAFRHRPGHDTGGSITLSALAVFKKTGGACAMGANVSDR